MPGMDAAAIADGVVSFASRDADFPPFVDVGGTPLVTASGEPTTFGDILAAAAGRGSSKMIILLGRNLL